MSYPTLVVVTDPEDVVISSGLPPDYTDDQKFNFESTHGLYEVNAAGAPTSNHLGVSGPFVVTMPGGEEVLCSFMTPQGQVTVWTFGALNGRGYNSTSAAAVAPGAPASVTETSAQDGPAGVPTFTGSGTPEGHQTATAKNETYIDSTTGDLWIYNGTPPSNTGWVLQGGGGGLPPWFQSGVGDPITANPTVPYKQYALYMDTAVVASVGLFIAAGVTSADWVLLGGVSSATGGLEFYTSGNGNWSLSNRTQTVFLFGQSAAAGQDNIGTLLNNDEYWQTFASHGSPNGSVTASEVGDFCVDVDTPALWRALAADNSHWVRTDAPSLMESSGATGVIFPEQQPTSTAPAYAKGGLYFDTTLNKLRVGGATAWETITSA